MPIAEARLDRSVSGTQDRYRRLVELSPDGIFIVQDDRIVLVNPAALRLMGASSPEQLFGKSPFELFHPEEQTDIRKHISRLPSSRSTSTVPLVEQRIVRFDRSMADVEVAATMLDDEQGRAVQLILRDITQRKQTEAALRESEERLTLAFAGAQEGVWDWNFETGAVVYSPRWKQMLGYEDDEIEPHVRAWERLLHPDDMPRAQELTEGVKRGEQFYEGEFRLRHKEGHYVHVLSRGYPVRREPGGPVVRIVGTHFDLTARRQADAERTRAELLTRMVFAQEDERRRIAREMHDQFGEQLTTLALNIGALKEACSDLPDLRVQVDALDAIAKQLDRDVDHLVWELRPTALDDLGLRAALTNYVQNWSRRVNIPAELHMPGLLDERLPSEAETTLYRIAQEALNNVAKHARATSVEIILERRADHVLLVVEDDGVGFEPAQSASDRQGFGLLGMQERAALVGATLQIESTEQGTTILVRMPMPPGNSHR
jgi:two-component system sensor histidine kinase UhpB